MMMSRAEFRDEMDRRFTVEAHRTRRAKAARGEVAKFMGTHLEPGEIERRREWNRDPGPEVLSLPETLVVIAFAVLGDYANHYIPANKEDI